MANNSTTAIPSNIGEVTGPLLMGYLFNYGLYGILCVQTYIYYTAFPKDKLYFRSLVYTVFVLDSIQTIMITYDAFQTFAYGFGDMNKLGRVGLFWFDLCFLDGIIAFAVQSFFAYRVRLLSRSKILIPGVILFTALASMSGAIAAGILAKQVEFLSQLQDKVFVGSAFWLGGSAACDVLIALCMTYTLSQANSTYKETQDLIRRLIIVTMETGVLTALAATADLIIFLGFPKLDVHITFTLSLAKLYSNSLLVILNTRLNIPGSRGYKPNGLFVTNSSHGAPTIDLTTFNATRDRWETRTERGPGSNSTTGIRVGVTEESITWSDDPDSV
ncbi:hypothetical protein V5O48_006302 [Marasmius crinis-equi]|uniref:DUF6534 domain-containing protein n=1 Tax=Marasmius crinis-equi TaxID=585013 RepID=A0ABR3FJV0_9AGAR